VAVLEAVSSWSAFKSTAVAVGVVILYTLLGGYRVVTATDVFQSVFVLIVLFCPFLLTVDIPALADVGSATAKGAASMLELAFLGGMSFTLTVARPELWQRVFSAASYKSLQRAFAIGTVLYVLFMLALVTLALAIMGVMPNGTALDMFAKGHALVLPAWLSSLFPVVLLAAMMSTLDSAAFALSVHLAEVTRRVDVAFSTRARIALVVVLLSGALASPYLSDVLTFAYFVNGLASVISVVLIALMLGRQIAGLSIAFWSGIVTVLALGLLGVLSKNQSLALLGSVVSFCFIAFGRVRAR
jgi:Na+/proline symporter